MLRAYPNNYEGALFLGQNQVIRIGPKEETR